MFEIHLVIERGYERRLRNLLAQREKLQAQKQTRAQQVALNSINNQLADFASRAFKLSDHMNLEKQCAPIQQPMIH